MVWGHLNPFVIIETQQDSILRNQNTINSHLSNSSSQNHIVKVTDKHNEENVLPYKNEVNY